MELAYKKWIMWIFDDNDDYDKCAHKHTFVLYFINSKLNNAHREHNETLNLIGLPIICKNDLF